MGRAKRTGKRVTDSAGEVRVVGKNANREGSVYFDAANRVWKATWYDAAGKRRTVSAATRTVAGARRDAKLADRIAHSSGGPLGDTPSVEDVAHYWLESVARPSVKPGTYVTYAKQTERICEAIGTVAMADLDVEEVRRFIAELRHEVIGEDGVARPRYGVAVTRNTRTQLRQIAAEAIELGYLQGANPVDRVRVPRETAVERTDRRTLTLDEVHQLLDVLDGTRRLDAAVGILFTVGLRASEVLGLAWDDLDLGSGEAVIRRAATHVTGRGVQIDSPRTVTTRGVVHLSRTVIGLLIARRGVQAEQRELLGPAWQTCRYEGRELDLVFTSGDGRPVPRQALHRAVHDACVRAGIDAEGVGTHTGRRTVVSLAYQGGADIADVARLVGHAQSSTTAGYLVDRGHRPAMVAAKVAALLDPAAN